jgi:enterochelin esterase family protein
MKLNRRFAAAVIAAILLSAPSQAQNDYEFGPDSLPQAGVPKGRVVEAAYVSPEDGIYPGTTRSYWVYIPAQYDGASPAALMVFNDGGGYAGDSGHTRVPIVFDNLIHKGEMPVTIGVFLNPGTVQPARPHAVARRNRSYEYDTMSDLYARFLIEQFLPMVEREHGVAFSTDPDMRGVAGLSTGGIAAFTVAWERPDSFRKVVTYIGTFVNIRNGDQYPGIIRKTSPIGRPLRVFLQDGENDLDNNHGNWPLANRAMDAALEYMGYDHKLVFGHGTHSGNHGGAIFPDAMRWIWRDWKSN